MLALDALELNFESVFTNPTSSGAFEWRALVSPASPSGAWDAATTYEVQSRELVPSRLTLTGRYDRRSRSAIVSGRFVAPGFDVGGTAISLYAKASGDSHFRYVAWTRTNGSGVFTFRRRLPVTTSFGAEIASIGRCSRPSAALAGCRSETAATLYSPAVSVKKGKLSNARRVDAEPYGFFST